MPGRIVLLTRVFSLICLLTAAVFAQLLEPSDEFLSENRIRMVRVEGLVNMDARSVLSRVSVRDGQRFSPMILSDKIQASVNSLYESGYFDDVSAWADYTENPNELDIIFKVKELPALDTIEFVGCDEITDEDLMLKISMIHGQVYNRSQLERDRQAILSYYRSEGYLLAEVGYREERVSEFENKIVFVVHEGEKVKVRKITISGNEHIPPEEFTDHMQTKIANWWGDGEFKEYVFETDHDTVLNVAKHFGYLDAELLEYRAEYMPDSTFGFYMGRMVAPGEKLERLYSQLNIAIQDTSHVMNKLAGRTRELPYHYFRRYRGGKPGRSAPLPYIGDEVTAAEVLNGLVKYGEIREQWIAMMPGLAWQNPKIDSLSKLGRKRTDYDEKMLVRYTLEELFPALAKYDSSKVSSSIEVVIVLNEGRRYYAGDVHFSGNEVLEEKVLQRAVRLEKGKPFDYYLYEETKREILNSYREDGYLFAQYEETREFVNDSVLNLSYRMYEGLPAQIHKVHIIGNTKTKDKVIRREVRLFPGDTYRQSALERSFREIMQLNYFDMVTPDIKVVNEQEVDLEFAVVEKEAGTGTFSLGVAYSQSDGLTGTASVSIPNCCMGDGQSASFSVEYGEEKHYASVSFSEPYFLDHPVSVGVTLSYGWWDQDDDPDITRYGGSVYVGKRLKWPDDYFYGQIGYSWLMNKQGDNVEGSFVKFTGVESALNFRLLRDDKNLPQFPTDGSRYVLDVQVADDLLFSDFSFIKVESTIKWWFPLFRDRLTLAFTHEYGVMFGSPLQYRVLYTMGGVLGYEGMMRGYNSGSIGYRRLGRSYEYLGLELQWGVVPQVFYLLPFFFDAGNVFGEMYDPYSKVSMHQKNPLREWDPSSLKRDVGFGFRVVVPMLGIIGFDFAWPLDVGESYYGYDDTSVGSMNFNFVIGNGF